MIKIFFNSFLQNQLFNNHVDLVLLFFLFFFLFLFIFFLRNLNFVFQKNLKNEIQIFSKN